MNNARRKALADTGRAAVGKTAVVGARDRATKRVTAEVVEATDKAVILQGFVIDLTAPGATFCNDDASACESPAFGHITIKHSLSGYVRDDAHANGIESLWSRLKRAHKGTFHKISPKHLNRYVQEFAGRHDPRDEDTIDILTAVASGMDGKRLRDRDLIAPNGARS